MARVGFKIKKRPPSAEKLINHIAERVEKVADDIGQQHAKERGKVINTWQGAVPSWSHTVKRKTRSIVTLQVFMEGDAFGQNKWRWLDQGTTVRHAVMTRDFRAKTRPEIISSYEGRGGKAYVSKSLKLPGIDARQWDRIVNERLTKRYNTRVNTQIKAGLKRKRL